MERAVFFLVVLLGVVRGAEWSYHDEPEGTYSWGEKFPLCNDGKSQSPIDISTRVARYNPILTSFTFKNYDSEDIDMTLSNSGYSAVVSVHSDDVMVMEGNLPGTFQMAQFHFHWGSDLWRGSEHTLNDKAYPAELHFVHFNTKYGNLSHAIDKKDGLAVLGIFMEAGDSDNSEYADIINGLKEVIHKDESHTLPHFKLETLLPEHDDQYYRYNGSLTTPGCFESVTWTVFKETVKLSPSQLEVFRTLVENPHGETDVPIVDNFRPVQPLNEREVWVSKMPPVPPVGAGNHVLANLYLALAIAIVSIFAAW